jgi:hypothetical protein
MILITFFYFTYNKDVFYVLPSLIDLIMFLSCLIKTDSSKQVEDLGTASCAW